MKPEFDNFYLRSEIKRYYNVWPTTTEEYMMWVGCLLRHNYEEEESLKKQNKKVNKR